MTTPEDALKESRQWLDVGGRRVRVAVQRPMCRSLHRPAPYVVMCHGFKGFMDWGFLPPLRRSFAEAGFVVVAMNTSGSGVGDDPLVMDDEQAFFEDSYSKQLEDIAAVRSFVRQRVEGIDRGAEVLFGHSRGGGMMVVAASEDPPRALITWAAIDEADRFDAATKQLWRSRGELGVPNARTGQVHRMSVAALDDLEAHRARFDIIRAAAALECPFLALHGDEDATVAAGAAQRLAGAAPRGQARIFEGGNHSFGGNHPMVDFDESALLARVADESILFAVDACQSPPAPS